MIRSAEIAMSIVPASAKSDNESLLAWPDLFCPILLQPLPSMFASSELVSNKNITVFMFSSLRSESSAESPFNTIADSSFSAIYLALQNLSDDFYMIIFFQKGSEL